MAHVVFGNYQIIATIILSTNDNVGVRVPCVVMINGDPVELRSKVRIDLCHHVPDKGLEISEFCPIISRYDQPELMAVTITGIEKGRSIVLVGFWTIELTRFTLRRDAVPLNVA